MLLEVTALNHLRRVSWKCSFLDISIIRYECIRDFILMTLTTWREICAHWFFNLYKNIIFRHSGSTFFLLYCSLSCSLLVCFCFALLLFVGKIAILVNHDLLYPVTIFHKFIEFFSYLMMFTYRSFLCNKHLIKSNFVKFLEYRW